MPHLDAPFIAAIAALVTALAALITAVRKKP